MSIFKDRMDRRLTLSLYFFEVLDEAQQIVNDSSGEGAELDNELGLATAIMASLIETDVCEEPTTEDVEYVADRLVKYYDEAKKASEEKSKEGGLAGTGKKTFAGEAMKFLGNLKPDEQCLYLADFDIEKAHHLYTQVDRDDIKVISEQKVGFQWEMMRVQFEASLFGFGGGYGDGESDPNAEVIDLTNGSTAGLDKFFGRAT